MSNRKSPLSPPPLARDVVGRILTTLQRIGTVAQKREAHEIETVLYRHFYEQPEAVSFATAEDEQPKGEGKKS